MPASPASPDEVSLALIDSLVRLNRRFRQRPVAGDLNQSEGSTLSRLARQAPASAALLARTEGISPQSMGSTIASLEARGLVVRRPDPEDGRRVLLDLTAAGRRRAEEKHSARTRQLADALARDFSDAELDRLRAVTPLLDRLAEAIR